MSASSGTSGSSIPDRATITKADGVLCRRTLDGVAVLPSRGDVMYLDRTGSLIWELVAQPTTVSDVVEAISRACSVDVADVVAGTHTLLVALRDAGALTESPP